MPVPMDEFPVHQTPYSMRHVGTSDRNFYDRCYFNAFDPSGDVMLITGAGVYPNLGVKDAYALVRRGDEQYAVRMSDALDDDRLNQKIKESTSLLPASLRRGAAAPGVTWRDPLE